MYFLKKHCSTDPYMPPPTQCVCVCVCALFVLTAYRIWKPEEGVRVPETGVTDGYELPWECWELNPGPLQEQPVLFPAPPSLQPKEDF